MNLGDRVNAARESTLARLRDGMDGIELARRLTDDFEGPVVELIGRCMAEAGFGRSSGLVVVATGGFGRREFAPHSDLDLVFLCRGEPDARVEALAQAILNPLWEARLDAGHAVRSMTEALELPATDLMSATAMLEARYLIGDEYLLSDFLSSYSVRTSSDGPESLVMRLRAEQQARHSKFGDTIYLLEPDIKSGPGGLRDLCVGRWASHARFGTGEARALVQLGQMLRAQADAFERAREWLLKVRIASHLTAGRKQDQLRFDLQEKIGPLLYGNVADAGGRVRSEVAPAVEALMGNYQVHARAVVRETERLMQRAVADTSREPTNIPVTLTRSGSGVDPNFVLRGGVLEVLSPETFEKKPSEMVRLFAAAVELDVPIGMRTTDWICELCVETPDALRRDPDSGKYFLNVLTDASDRATPSRLEQMQDMGVLAALIPEWNLVLGRVQHDLYHVYTVDQHSLYSVSLLKALARGDLIDQFPLQVEQMSLIERPLPLYVAMLLHDVGKPLGPNHPINGARIAVDMARRLGLSEADVGQVELLVREHLTMGHVSQRRDLSDPATIQSIAELCDSEEILRQLYLETFSDLQCVGPGNLTPWKEDLLRELFLRTLAHVRHGPDSVVAAVRQRVADRREQAVAMLSHDHAREVVEGIFDSLPDRYFIENSVGRIVSHVGLIGNRKGPCAVAFVHHARREYTEMVLVADDVPGLLATVTGVLFANRIDILEAAIYSRTRKNIGMEALDVFRIRRPHHGAVTDDDRLAKIRSDLETTLSGKLEVRELVSARPRTTSLFERARPKVPPTEVYLHNDFSPDYTIIDVFTEDRPGVLYTITRMLHEKNLDIRRSKVGVEADRVADIFYVLDRAGGRKIEDPMRLKDIGESLKVALASHPGR